MENSPAKVKNRKKVVIICSVIVLVFILAPLLGLIITGAQIGWGPFRSIKYHYTAKQLTDKTCSYSVSTEYIMNGDQRIFGTLYLPEDDRETREIVIVAHGFAVDSSYDEPLGRTLAMAGIAVYTFDFGGGSPNGKSDGKSTEMSVLTEKAELNAVVDFIKTWQWVDTDKIILLGQSQGGLVSALTAAERNDIFRLILFYPAFCIPDYARKEYATIDDIPDRIQKGVMEVGRVYYTDIFDLDPYSAIPRYKNEVLIIHGTADEAVPYTDSQKAASLYDRAELQLIEGAGHGFVGKNETIALKYVYQFILNAA